MLSIVRNALGPASYPNLQKSEVIHVSQTSEPVNPRAPIVQPSAEPKQPAETKE